MAPRAPEKPAPAPRAPETPAAAPAKPVQTPPVSSARKAPADLKEYIEQYAPDQTKKQLSAGLILAYVASGITGVAALILGQPYMLFDVLLVLVPAVILQLRKTKSAAWVLLIVGAAEMILTTVSAQRLSGWLPFAGALTAFLALRSAAKEYDQFRSAPGAAPASAPAAVPRQTAAPAPGMAPAYGRSAAVSVFPQGQKQKRDIALLPDGAKRWKEGRAELSNEQIVLYTYPNIPVALIGLIGKLIVNMIGGKETMRFSPGEIEYYVLAGEQQIHLALRSGQAVTIQGKKEAVSLFAQVAQAAGASRRSQ